MNHSRIPHYRRLAVPAWLLLAMCSGSVALADTGHHHGGVAMPSPPAPFVATTAKSFSELMAESMAIMDDGMARAPMNGDPDRDFVNMMIPHHQGAVDMAKALFLYSSDPELRNLAQQIVTDQQNEINIMRAWLQHHPVAGPTEPNPSPSH